MNEDKIIWMISRLDDERAEKEIDRIMEGVDFDMESIKEKAVQKLSRHNKKSNLRRRLAYAAAVCACFICLNAVYADEISETIKSFFNKTPVYSTMVDGSAYYLPENLKLDDKTTITSFMVSADRMEMELTSGLSEEAICAIKVLPKNDSGIEYTSGGYSMDGDHKYALLFMNEKEKKYGNYKPASEYNLLIGGKTYMMALEEAKSLNAGQKLTESAPNANKIGLVKVGANSTEKDGKRGVQLIASFKDKEMKLHGFGQPDAKPVKQTVENQGKDGIISTGSGLRLADLYANDEKGNQYKLEKPANTNARPITNFVIGAPEDLKLIVNLPALVATYEKEVGKINISIPKNGAESPNSEIDLLAQKAVIKKVTRLSPTSARLELQLNTGAEKYVKIRSFNVFSEEIKKVDSEFKDDTATITLEFMKNTDEATLEVSWPQFAMNGNWTIDLK